MSTGVCVCVCVIDSRHLGSLKSQNYIDRWDPDGQDASPCNISPKSANLLWRYSDFSIFQNGSRCHLGFLNFLIFWLLGSGEPRCLTVPYFIKISKTISDISQFFDFLRRWLPPSWIFKILKRFG